MMGISFPEADDLFLDVVYNAATGVINAVRVPLRPREFDALVSLQFNLKPNTFANSKLVLDINKSDYATAVSDFTLVGNQAGGLHQRRINESIVFGSGVYINH